MEKNLAVKSNRKTLQWVENDENDDEPKGLTDLSTIQNQSDGFKSADTEAFKGIENNDEFKKAFNEFIDEILKTQNAGKASSEYMNLLKTEILKKEKDSNYEINNAEIDKARQKFLNHPDADGLSRDGNFDKETYELDIEKKFPKQMHELKRLMSIGDPEKRAKLLLGLGKRFGVDDEKLKRFINDEYLIEVPDAGEIMEEMDEETAKKMRGEKKFQVSKAAGPVNFKTSVEKGLRPLSETLSQIELSGEGSDPSLIKELENDFNQVKAFLKMWEGSDEQTVRNWARRKKGQLQQSEALETVAVMDQANYLMSKGHRLRDPQILAILIFLKSKKNQGKLCQIQTGEGKTIIVSLLVTIKVLQGKQVDVITSNQVLAKEGTTKREKFFDVMGISVDCNNADESYTNGPRKCYEADVVYGSIGNFQFDYLRHSFEGFETRGTRRFDTVVLDEVDSMLIDNGGYVAKLAGPFPGIESLKYVYLKIWQELIKAVEEQGIENNRQLTAKAEELNKDITSSEDELQEKFESFQGKVLKSQTDEIKARIKATNPANFRLIPQHLKAHAESCVDTWLGNAVYAYFDCNENEEYVIKKKDGEDVIVPVDYQNTGMTLRNTIWSNGLHQFVQLKHNLHLTSETLTTCFISNVGFIKLYKNNMFGLTGTLGSTNEQKMLSKAYSVNYATIPTYKDKKFSEIPGVVVSDDHWHNRVTLESFIMTRKKRSVLIICETIKELQDLEKNIKALKKLENLDTPIIHLYPDEDSSSVTKEIVGESEIIIATNIAGRGTDFQTNDLLEAAGGLHVFVSFLPVNKRVEDQAFGRTSRQGMSGSAQLIIKESDVTDLGKEISKGMTFDAVKQIRDEVEKERLDNIENFELAEIDFQDEIFTLFSELYVEFKEDDDKHFVSKDLKEFWAFWLKNKHYKGKNVKALNVFDEFESFKLEASVILGSDGGKGKINHNPYYSILETESLLSVHNINEAREALDNAMTLAEGNSDILISIPLKKFEIAIESGRQLTERFSKALKKVFLVNLFEDIEKDEAYKASATVALEEAKKSMEIEMDHMKKHIIDEGGNADFKKILIPVENNLLLKHLYSRYLALEAYHSNVQGLLDQIAASGNTIGLALISKVPKFFKEPETVAEKKIKESITKKELNELSAVGVEYFYGLQEVHDVPEQIIRSAQGQILAGIAVLTACIAFPPSLPAILSTAATFIAEGVCDIVIELISKGSAGFDAAAYIKQKSISYSISIVTLGISAISTSVRILNQAVKVCKGVADILRSSPFFKNVCEKMAAMCDRFIALLNKTKNLKAFEKMNKTEQLDHLRKLELAGELEKLKALGGVQNLSKLETLEKLGKLREGLTRTQAFKEAFKIIGKETTEGVASTIAGEKLVTELIERIFEELKPKIKEMVKKTIDENLNKKNLRLMEPEPIFKLTQEILEGTLLEMGGEVLKEVSLGVLRHAKSRRAKIASLVADTGISLAEIFTYTKHFCEKFNAQSGSKIKSGKEPASNEVVDESINLMADLVTQKVYGMITNLTGKYVGTLVVNPIMRKVFHDTNKKGQKNVNFTDEERKRISKFDELIDAHDVLGVKPGASEFEINKARRKAMLENHPDRNRNDPNAHEKAQKINEAYDLIMSALHQKTNPQTTTKSDQVPIKLLAFNNEFPEIVKKNPEMAHRGNIKTLSDTANQHIVVNIYKENGKISRKDFGKKFAENGNETIVLNYTAPSKDSPGHFEASGVDIETQISSGPNNCFFDAYVAVLKSHGIDANPYEIRKLAEQPSFYNTMYDGIKGVTKILKNPLTNDMFNKSQGAILVGAGDNPNRSVGSSQELANQFKNLDLPRETSSRENSQKAQSPKNNNEDAMSTSSQENILDKTRRRDDLSDSDFSDSKPPIKKNKDEDEMEISSLENSPKTRKVLVKGDPPLLDLNKDADKKNVDNSAVKLKPKEDVENKKKKEKTEEEDKKKSDKDKIKQKADNDDEEAGSDLTTVASNIKKEKDDYNFKEYLENIKKTPLKIKYPKLEIVNIKPDIIQDETNYGILRLSWNMPKSEGVVWFKAPSMGWPSTQTKELPKISFDKKYKEQMETLKIVLTPEGTKKLKNLKLHRGHLAGKMDFISLKDQGLTYNFENTLPMWSSINSNGNWYKKELYVRALAAIQDVKITIGRMGVLTLKDPNGVEKEIYLDHENKRIPVPKSMYKIITTKNDKNEDVREVFVFSNDPFKNADEIKNEAVELFGTDFIELKDNFVDPVFGYTYQVNYEKFKSVINIDEIKPDLVESRIKFSHGDMVIQKHKTDLGTVQADFTIPSTKDLKKEKVPTFIWPSGDQTEFGGMIVYPKYEIKSQKIEISKAITPEGSDPVIHEYVSDQVHLQKGHMAAKQDFPTVEEQKLSHRFHNAIPQWNTINRNGSIWYDIEKQTRNDALKTDLRITIGTLGIMSLRGKEIYLDYDAKKIPVPRYVYKIITDENGTKVYVFFNNPYIEEADVRKEMNDIFGDEIVHLSDKPGTGYTFTTTYENFREKTNDYFKGFELPEVAQKPTPKKQLTENDTTKLEQDKNDSEGKLKVDADNDVAMQ